MLFQFFRMIEYLCISSLIKHVNVLVDKYYKKVAAVEV